MCSFKKLESSNRNLFYLLEQKLPLDVLYHIYTFCDVDEKRQIREHYHKEHPIIVNSIILAFSIVMYFLGYLVTRSFSGIFIIINFLLGYLILTALSLILTMIFIPFKMCIVVND